MKHKLIFFGSGFYGQNAYLRFHDDYEIICYVDNNVLRVGTNIYGVPVIGIDELAGVYNSSTMDILITTKQYYEISAQVAGIGIKDYFVFMEGFLYHTNENETMMPVELYCGTYYKKNDSKKTILFLQNAPCIRTYKIARLIKEKGYDVQLLYSLNGARGEDGEGVFHKEYGFTSMKGIVDFIKNSEFDLLHCSNSPDIMTNLALLTNKPVVHDTHDMMSLWGYDSVDERNLEFIANVKSDGNIYTSDAVTELAKEKFGLNDKPVLTLENFIFKQFFVTKPHDKISYSDGEIHLVYEGGIVETNKNDSRYMENMWDKIVACGIHIHFYTQADPEYARRLSEKSEFYHYEGNMSSEQLITEMTKYDAGLALFNVTEKNKIFLETGTANKVYEYLNSGLPVIVADIKSYDDFVEKYGVGISIDLGGDILDQVRKALEIHIPDNILENNKLTMTSKADELVLFYEKVMRQGKSRTSQRKI